MTHESEDIDSGPGQGDLNPGEASQQDQPHGGNHAAHGGRDGIDVEAARAEITEPASEDYGSPATIVYTTFRNDGEQALTPGSAGHDEFEQGAVWTVGEAGPETTYRVRLLAVRDSGRVHDLWVNRVDADTSTEHTVLHLTGTEAARFVELLGNPALADLAGRQLPPPQAPAAVAGTPELQEAYARDPDLFREMIASDATASDVIAHARRRRTVADFRMLLEDPELFDQRARDEGGPEQVWQHLFESNHWLLGGSLAGTLFTSWDPQRLEQTAVGRSISSVGKRPDALLRSAGLIGSMAFVEIKHHRTPLLATASYRSGTWPVSPDLAGAVAQSQVTVQLVVEELRDRMQMIDADGVDLPSEFTYLFRPRSFVVAGSLTQLTGGTGGHDRSKIRSFELYRRSLTGPEILTFDEVLARAELIVSED